MNKDRISKLESVCKDIISQYFLENITGELNDDFSIISITGVKISSDLSYLDIYVSSFKNQEKLPKALAHYGFELQRILNKKIETRKLPKIRFRYDSKGATAQDICSVINSLDIKDTND